MAATEDKEDLKKIRTERELIVMAKPRAGLRATTSGSIASFRGTDVNSLVDVLSSTGSKIEPLFGDTEERIYHEVASISPKTDFEVPDLSIYYRIQAPNEKLDDLAHALREQETIEAAYVKPKAEPPVPLKLSEEEIEKIRQAVDDMLPSPKIVPLRTPSFVDRQGYLDASPEGIFTLYAWAETGGRGNGVNIIDLEYGWNFAHEDLRENQGGVKAGKNLIFINHGTAVLGILSGDQNKSGITGICSDAEVSAISFDPASARAIRLAAILLQPGDIMLLEAHRPGPQFDFQPRDDRKGYIPIEWWPDDFDAIRYAVARGVIVVEAAGNGAVDLDNSIYDIPHPNFPINWSNPFRRGNRDSDAIIVGAGAPPPGTHGRNHGPDRSRLGFSNYGLVVDAQGWGDEVTTTGYGDLQGGYYMNRWYTDNFSGTSSASPIVVGALACVQGILLGRGDKPLSPTEARALLRSTGSYQQDAPGRPRTQRIGNRPDLYQIIQALNRIR